MTSRRSERSLRIEAIVIRAVLVMAETRIVQGQRIVPQDALDGAPLLVAEQEMLRVVRAWFSEARRIGATRITELPDLRWEAWAPLGMQLEIRGEVEVP